MIELLENGLAEIGIEPSERQIQQLESYISELELWNTRLNLVSFENREQLIIRHILDCLAALPFFLNSKNSKTIADIGSGAGLPGLLLAIFLEEHEITLVERSGKKAGFLRSVSAILGLSGRVTVIDRDLGEVRDCFDIVTCRAFRDFAEFAVELRRIVAESGFLVAYKGRLESIMEDLSAAGIETDKAVIKQIRVPFLNEERHLLVM